MAARNAERGLLHVICDSLTSLQYTDTINAESVGLCGMQEEPALQFQAATQRDVAACRLQTSLKQGPLTQTRP